MKYAGKNILIGGRMLVVPSITLGMARTRFAETLRSLADTSTETTLVEKFAAALPLFVAAIQRNYPDITEAWLEGEVDYNNVPDLLTAVMGNVPAGERVPGEEQATAVIQTGTGNGSTVALLQPPAGPSST